MTEMQRYTGPGLSRSGGRVGREVARIEAGGSVRLARLDAETELLTAKLDVVAQVGQRALQNTAMLTQMEAGLIQAVPLAASRLEAIGNATALTMAGMVAETASRIRRF